MSRIDDLIKKHCPNGVAFKRLGDVIEKNLGGGTPSKSVDAYWNGDIPWASVGDLSIPGLTVNSTRNHITPEGLAKSSSNLIKKGNLLVAVKISPGRMKIAGADIAINQDLRGLALKPEMDTKFLAYYFQTIDFVGNGTIVKAITSAFLERTRIPVPPIEVQREIVRVLDTFSKLEAELEAELEARRKQYTFYRDQLLTFTERERRIRWATMTEICLKISSGGTPSSGRADFYAGGVPWLRTQEVDYRLIQSTSMTITEAGMKNSAAKWIPANCVIVAMYGATAAKVAINGIPLTTNQACCNLQVDPDQAEFRFVYHWIAKQYAHLRSLGEGSQSNLNAQKIKDYPIPVPPLEDQRRIVQILDKFDALVNDLSLGLPAELKARRQQYEHYRDRLLTFREAT